MDSSRIRKSQMPFWPRFSTGEYGYTDLSFWQFIVQEQWSGGAGQDLFITTNKHRESGGWDFRGCDSPLSQGPQLAGGSEDAAGVTAPTQLGKNWDAQATFLRYGRKTSPDLSAANGSRLLLVSDTPAAAYGTITGYGTSDGSISSLRTPTKELCGISQVSSKHAAIMFREYMNDLQAFGSILVVLNAGPQYVAYDETLTALDTRYFCYESTNTGHKVNNYPSAIVPLDQDNFLMLGMGPANSVSDTNKMTLQMQKVKYDPNTFSITPLKGQAGDVFNSICQQTAIDSTGAVYFAAFADTLSGFASDHGGSQIGIITLTDLMLANGPRLSAIHNYPNLIITGLVSVAGVIYIIGARVLRVGSTIQYRNMVMQYPSTIVWESPLIQSSSTPQNLPKAISQVNLRESIFVTPNSFGDFDSVMHILPGGVVEEIAALPKLLPTATCDNTYMAVQQMGGAIYAYDCVNNKIVRAGNLQNITRPARKNCSLTLSGFGGNTTLVNKSLYKLIVELTSPLIGQQDKLSISVNGISLGTYNPALEQQASNVTSTLSSDGTQRIEFVTTTEVTAGTFYPTLQLPSGTSWTGRLRRVVCQYIPTQLKKRAWGIAVRCESNQKLMNDQRDPRKGWEKFADLEAAWRSNVPIPFEDVDGKTYQVIVTEWQERMPLIKSNRDQRESICSMELLEV